MTQNSATEFHVGHWFVEPSLGRVSNAQRSFSLRPREMDLLVFLAGRPGEVVTADEIISEVWSGVAVTTDSLYFSMSQLRKALDVDSAKSLIETIPKRGYRLVVDVQFCADESTLHDRTATERQRSRSFFAMALFVTVAVAILFSIWLSRESHVDVVELDVPQRSIAVMPFIDLTPETDYTYFSDGITEEILNQLRRVPDLQVAARTSSFSFKHSDAGVVEIGRTLGVSTVLEGSVRKEGDRVRIAAQLIDANTGFQIWSDTFDRKLSSVLAIQNDISTRIAESLEITFAGATDSRGDPSDGTLDPVVLDEYLQGLEALRIASFESLARAEQHFENVLARNPRFHKASVQLAYTKLQALNIGLSSDRSLIGQAENLLTDVLADYPRDGAARRVLGMVRKWQGRQAEARRELNFALELSPSDSEAMVMLSHIVGFEGDVAEARRLLDRALRIDPFASNVLYTYAALQRSLGATSKALEALSRAVELHPGSPSPPWWLGRLQVNDLGDLSGGLNSFLTSARLDVGDYEIPAYAAMTYLFLGLPDAATQWLDRALRDAPNATTSLAVRAIESALAGDHASAANVAALALRNDSHRMMAHSTMVSALLTIVTSELLRHDRADDAVDLLEKTIPGKFAPSTTPAEERLDPILAYSMLPRRWLVSLAFAYRGAGNVSGEKWALERLASARIDAIGHARDALRQDDYLLEAEILALQGDSDRAIEMLAAAVERNLLFGWQVLVENNVAFESLRTDPRYQALLAKLANKTLLEQQRAVASLELLSGQSPTVYVDSVLSVER